MGEMPISIMIICVKAFYEVLFKCKASSKNKLLESVAWPVMFISLSLVPSTELGT